MPYTKIVIPHYDPTGSCHVTSPTTSRSVYTCSCTLFIDLFIIEVSFWANDCRAGRIRLLTTVYGLDVRPRVECALNTNKEVSDLEPSHGCTCPPAIGSSIAVVEAALKCHINVTNGENY